LVTLGGGASAPVVYKIGNKITKAAKPYRPMRLRAGRARQNGLGKRFPEGRFEIWQDLHRSSGDDLKLHGCAWAQLAMALDEAHEVKWRPQSLSRWKP
jgi:hypothetical protein